MLTERTRRMAISLAAAAALAGCAPLRPRAGFEDVERLVGDRSEVRLAWRDDGDAETGVRRTIESWLAEELTAERAVQIAVFNNRGLQATYRRLGIAQADLVQAGLLPNPVLDTEVRFDGGNPFEVVVVQELLGILQIPLRKRVAAAAFEQAKLEIGQAVWDLATKVRAAFYRLEGAEQTLEMRRTVARATRYAAELASRQHEAGNLTELDLAGERALDAQATLELASADAEVLAEREELNELLGMFGGDVSWRSAGRLPPLPEPEISPEGLESVAVRRRLDLAAARQELEVLARTHGLTRLYGLVPEASTGIHTEREPEGTLTVGPALGLAVPIFDRRQAALARVEAEAEQAWERYSALAVAIRSEVRRQRTRMLAARARAEYYRSVVLPLRRRIVEQSQLQYNAMQVGAVPLIQAKREEVEAARASIEALTEYWVSRAELERATGGDLRASSSAEPEEQDHHH